MRKPVLFFLTLFMSLTSTSTWGASLPAVNYPGLSQLEALEPPDLVKDAYETTAEFEKRKKDAASSNRAAISFFGEVYLDYDADKEAYLVETCFNRTVVEDTSSTRMSGTNAMGAEWSWSEIKGRSHKVKAGACGDPMEIPYDLTKARAIRNSVKAVAMISLGGQEPKRSSLYESAEWGKSVVQKVATYTYKGEIDEIYVGTPEQGVVASVNMKQAREKARQAREKAKQAAEEEARKLREAHEKAAQESEEEARKLRESQEKAADDFSCPSSKAVMTEAVRLALDDGNVALYRVLVKCPKPRR